MKADPLYNDCYSIWLKFAQTDGYYRVKYKWDKSFEPQVSLQKINTGQIIANENIIVPPGPIRFSPHPTPTVDDVRPPRECDDTW